MPREIGNSDFAALAKCRKRPGRFQDESGASSNRRATRI